MVSIAVQWCVEQKMHYMHLTPPTEQQPTNNQSNGYDAFYSQLDFEFESNNQLVTAWIDLLHKREKSFTDKCTNKEFETFLNSNVRPSNSTARITTAQWSDDLCFFFIRQRSVRRYVQFIVDCCRRRCYCRILFNCNFILVNCYQPMPRITKWDEMARDQRIFTHTKSIQLKY